MWWAFTVFPDIPWLIWVGYSSPNVPHILGLSVFLWWIMQRFIMVLRFLSYVHNLVCQSHIFNGIGIHSTWFRCLCWISTPILTWPKPDWRMLLKNQAFLVTSLWLLQWDQRWWNSVQHVWGYGHYNTIWCGRVLYPWWLLLGSYPWFLEGYYNMCIMSPKKCLWESRAQWWEQSPQFEHWG